MQGANIMTVVNKKKLYGFVFAVCVAFTAVAGLLTSIVTYPTQAHLDVARQLEALNSQAFNDFTILESSEFLELSATAEAQYSEIAMIVTTILWISLSIVLVWWVYHYLRYRRASKTLAWTTAWIVSVAGVVGFFPMVLYETFIVFENVSGSSFAMTLFILALVAPIMLPVNYVLARIFHWTYERRRTSTVK